MSHNTADWMEEAIRNLLETHSRLTKSGIEPQILAGAFLSLGISRFANLMGESQTALMLEQTAVELRERGKTFH